MEKQLQHLMKLINGLADIEILKSTKKEFIFEYHGLGCSEVYYDGLVFLDLMPEVLGMRDNQINGAKVFAERMKNHESKCEWAEIMGMIDKRIGLSTYINRFDDIPDKVKYDAFIEIYQRSEFGFEILKDRYQEIFEYAKYSKLREKRIDNFLFTQKPFVKIYHGESLSYPVYDDYSWTLSRKTVEWFAYRYNSVGRIWTKTINTVDAVDYLTDRNEQEILYNYG